MDVLHYQNYLIFQDGILIMLKIRTICLLIVRAIFHPYNQNKHWENPNKKYILLIKFIKKNSIAL